MLWLRSRTSQDGTIRRRDDVPGGASSVQRSKQQVYASLPAPRHILYMPLAPYMFLSSPIAHLKGVAALWIPVFVIVGFFVVVWFSTWY